MISSLFLEKILNGYFGEVNAIVLILDGKILVSGGLKIIKIWNFEIGEVKKNIGDVYKNKIIILVVIFNGKMLVSGSIEKIIKIWDIKIGELLRFIVG